MALVPVFWSMIHRGGGLADDQFGPNSQFFRVVFESLDALQEDSRRTLSHVRKRLDAPIESPTDSTTDTRVFEQPAPQVVVLH
jgi:hypothetical protein